jgi:hypothetical protein
VHDATDPLGRLLFNVLALVAEFETDLARMRTREGMKVAKAKGRLRGQQPKLSRHQEAHLVALYHAGAHTISELEDVFSGGHTRDLLGDPTRVRHLHRRPRSGRRGVNPEGRRALPALIADERQRPRRAGGVVTTGLSGALSGAGSRSGSDVGTAGLA